MTHERLIRLAAALPLVFMASGCGLGSALDDAMSGEGFGGPPKHAVAEASAPPRAGAPGVTAEQWCGKVASEDRARAGEDGFDPATQQRRYDTSFRQCVAVFGAAPAE